MPSNFYDEGFVHIKITAEINKLLHYAENLAGKLEQASTNPAYTHQTRGLAGAIRENIAILRGEQPKRKETSLGELDFFQVQIKMAEDRLILIAEDIFKRKP